MKACSRLFWAWARLAARQDGPLSLQLCGLPRQRTIRMALRRGSVFLVLANLEIGQTAGSHTPNTVSTVGGEDLARAARIMFRICKTEIDLILKAKRDVVELVVSHFGDIVTISYILPGARNIHDSYKVYVPHEMLCAIRSLLASGHLTSISVGPKVIAAFTRVGVSATAYMPQ